MLEYGIKIPRDIAFHLLFESGLDNDDQVNDILDWLTEPMPGFIYFQELAFMLVDRDDCIINEGERYKPIHHFGLENVEKDFYQFEPETHISNKGPIVKRGKNKIKKYGR